MLDITRKQGRITVADAVALTQGNRNTIRANLKRLVEAGHLKQYGTSGRGVWYGLN
jgi:predicted HTH transcriptional regulator